MGSGDNRKVLIVDDLPDSRFLMRMTLGRSGWDVLEAADGREAVNMASIEMPDVVLMDYNMPIMDGVEACRQLNDMDETAHIPVIIYTGAFSGGNAPNSLKNQAFEAGAVEFLVKPIMPNDLKAKVEAVYQRGKQPR
jgi:CheY-like chemotaxis protein